MKFKCSYCGNIFDKKSSQTECSVKCKMLNKTEITENCWIWKGNVSQFGYGRVRIKNEPSIPAHRVMYEVYKGKIESGLNVCHSCDNKLCVNPEHLWLGTDKQNHDDMVAKGRKNIYRGSDSRLSKLKEKDVFAIVSLVKSGVNRKEVAKNYNVDRSTIDRIFSKKSWSHLEI